MDSLQCNIWILTSLNLFTYDLMLSPFSWTMENKSLVSLYYLMLVKNW